MAARLGNVLYWAACMLAALCLAIGLMMYPGADTMGVEVARQHGQSDAQILEHLKQPGKMLNFDVDEALKAGYSPSEVLNYLVEQRRSWFGGLPDRRAGAILIAATTAALLLWLAGRALRYVLAGT